MDRRRFISNSAAALLALGLGSAVSDTWAASPEQCFGIARAGQNDCAGLSGLHSCQGLSKVSFNPGDFRVVPAGTCRKLGGLTRMQAVAVLGDPAKVKAFEARMAARMAQRQP